MRTLFYLIMISPMFISCKQNLKKPENDYRIRPVSFTQVNIRDSFWAPRIQLNHSILIPQNFRKCEETGRIANFSKAAARSGKYTGRQYDDSDVYKIIEGAAFSLHHFPDPIMEAYVDSLIELISSAQEPDGYLFTVRTMQSPGFEQSIGNERWEYELNGSHELYNVGHLFEAAAAWYHTTGKDNLLNIAVKNADFLVSTFGPGKKSIAPGHQGIEMGLVKLYQITGKEEYLGLARFFVDSRGKVDYPYDPSKSWQIPENRQTHKPLLEQNEAVGHAVRAAYMYAGIADLVAIAQALDYMPVLEKLWEDVVYRKMYLTGGIGSSRAKAEAFGDPYDLPNTDGYAETCASIANIYWNHRMFLLTGNAKYLDILERTLYNGFLAGVSLSGDRFFYPNPLEFDGHYCFNADNSCDRMEWFSCSCCPTNVCRFLPSIGNYFYATSNDTIFVNLFGSSSANLILNGHEISLVQKTSYPYEGKIQIAVHSNTPVKAVMAVRIPGWVRNTPVPGDLYHYLPSDTPSVSWSLEINKTNYSEKDIKNGFVFVPVNIDEDSELMLDLPMSPRMVISNEAVEINRGRTAFEYGPFVLCAEEADNGKTSLLTMPGNPSFEIYRNTPGLPGIISLKEKQSGLVLIPYFAWANRGRGEMKVWL